VQFAVRSGVLLLVQNQGRSNFFFNAGLFDDGAKARPAGAILCLALLAKNSRVAWRST
jgi:hypothetical protein